MVTYREHLTWRAAFAQVHLCAHTSSELTHGNVEMRLRVGATTQAEVLETFGAPNITTIDGAGREVWTYQRNATVAQSSADSQ